MKNILFLDGAVATFAPEIDLLSEIASVGQYFAIRHGARITQEIGLDVREATC